jgi:hypothetical protein
MKWEDVEVMRIYMKSGAVFQYYDFTKLDGDPVMFAHTILSVPHNNASISSAQVIQIIKHSEVQSVEFEVKNGI